MGQFQKKILKDRVGAVHYKMRAPHHSQKCPHPCAPPPPPARGIRDAGLPYTKSVLGARAHFPCDTTAVGQRARGVNAGNPRTGA